VIHGTGDQDIRNMGGLKSKMPATFITFFIATLAICGIPPLSGFFSKDEILLKAFEFSPVLWVLGLTAAFCTAFYMSRLLFLTFYGEYRGHHHVHESPFTMTFPLKVLAFLSLVGGLVGVPLIAGANVFEPYLSNVFGHHATHPSEGLIVLLMVLAIAASAAGIYLARLMYIKRPEMAGKVTDRIRPVYKLVANKYYVDEGYDKAIVKPLQNLNLAVGRFDNEVIDGAVNLCGDATAAGSNKTGYFDNQVVDGFVNWTANATSASGEKVRKIQTGNVKSYITMAVAGGLIIITLFCGYYLLRDEIRELVSKFVRY
jgi:NADH-quinone oxidoreductase subunit L